MNQPFKRFMVMLLVVGVIVAASGLAMGGSTAIVWGAGGPRAVRNERKTLDVAEQLQFAELRVDTSVAEVRVIAGDAFRIEAEYLDGSEPRYSLDAGALRVFDSGEGASAFRVAVGISLSGPNRVTVTLPRGLALARAEISGEIGDTWLEGLSIDALTVRNSTGKISMKDISCGELEANASVGSIELDGVSTTRRMDASSGAGSVRGSGTFDGDVSMTADVGSVDIAVQAARDQYQLDAKANIGSVTIKPDAPNPIAAPNTMRLRSGAGSVRVQFER